jgi:hypothetical protein
MAATGADNRLTAVNMADTEKLLAIILFPYFVFQLFCLLASVIIAFQRM